MSYEGCVCNADRQILLTHNSCPNLDYPTNQPFKTAEQNSEGICSTEYYVGLIIKNTPDMLIWRLHGYLRAVRADRLPLKLLRHGAAASLDDGWRQHRYITHACRRHVFFTSVGQIRFVKSLLRLTYEAVVNGNHISVIGHPIIPPIQTHAWAGPRQKHGTDQGCGSSESVAFQRVKARRISHKCSLNSLSS